MFWKVPMTVTAVALLAATASCPDGHRPDSEAGRAEPEIEVVAMAPEPPAAATTVADTGSRLAIERALPVLLTDGDAWMEGTAPFQDGDGCVSCHQVPYGVWGLHEAARAGVIADADGTADLTSRAVSFIDNMGTGRPMSWSPMVLALGSAGAADVAAYSDFLLRAQRSAGQWEAKGQFPAQRRELSETNAVATMFSMLALAPAAGTDEAVAESVDAGWGWVLERGPGTSTEWLALRALVAEMRGDEDEASLLVDQLLERQNEDGGWSWNPGEESNAMSTGEALWALARVSTAAETRVESVRRGIEYLVATQGDDGWWRVASDLTSKGGEESKDYVYDYWGTAWATIGLAAWYEATDAGS